MNIYENKNYIIVAVLIGVVLNMFVWYSIVFDSRQTEPGVYFFDIGQGDSTFVQLEGGVEVLIDGGPSGRILEQLERVMGPTDRYIDVVVMTHPQLDHFGGLIDVIKRYRVGVFLHNGGTSSLGAYAELQKSLRARNVYSIALDDKDRMVYQGAVFDVLWPAEDGMASKDPNDSSLVMKLKQADFSMLLTADISMDIERQLIGRDIAADILKVPHHGSRYSSSKEFLRAVRPRLSVIEVGKNNYGHPTKETLSRLAAAGSMIFRTDESGLIKVKIKDGLLRVYAQ